MISEAQIADWLNKDPEDERLEFKEAKNTFDRTKLFKYIVSLANEFGGFLVLGISDKIPRKIVGCSAFKNIGDLRSEIRNNTNLTVEIEELEIEAKRVVVIRAPSRPRGTAYQFRGAYLMRCGEELLPMPEDRLRDIFGENGYWEDDSVKSRLTAEEVCDLLDVRTFFSLLDVPEPENAEEKVNKLAQLRLVSEDGNKFSITNIGAITLARDLNSFPSLTRKAPRLIVYNGKDKLDTKLDLTGRLGYAVGFQGLVRQCMQQMPKNEVVEDALRRTVELFPERAMREVIANALVHQDFASVGTGPLIEIYSNRIEVSNPGKPLVPVQRFIDGHQSRNERLARTMRALKICEERSSGIDRVVDTAEVYQLPAPDFIESYQSTTVVIYGPREFRLMTSDDKIRACYQHCVLRYVMREQMTNESLCERFGLTGASRPTVSKIIKSTVDSGLVATDPAIGASRKYARYVPAWTVHNMD